MVSWVISPSWIFKPWIIFRLFVWCRVAKTCHILCACVRSVTCVKKVTAFNWWKVGMLYCGQGHWVGLAQQGPHMGDFTQPRQKSAGPGENPDIEAIRAGPSQTATFILFWIYNIQVCKHSDMKKHFWYMCSKWVSQFWWFLGGSRSHPDGSAKETS